MDPLTEEYHIFNDHVFGQSPTPVAANEAKFSLFARLPAELCHRVWRQCLPPHRFIGIRITDSKITSHSEDEENDASSPEPYTVKNHLGNIISSYPYRMLVSQFDQWSRVLMQVSHEACDVFYSFYRLSLPLGPEVPLRLRVNPETDVLEVHRETDDIQTLVAFFHDTVAYDPRRIGITQLAMGRKTYDVPALASLDPKDLNPSALKSITTLCCESIRRFYACACSRGDSRQLIGVLSAPGAPYYLNRSVPIAAQGKNQQSSCFKSFDSDPRPIDTDLKWVVVLINSRRIVFHWRKFVTKFGPTNGTTPRPEIQVRYLQGIWPRRGESEVYTRNKFIEYLKTSDSRWEWWRSTDRKPLWGDSDREDYDRLSRDLDDVVGMWVFKEEAFSELPEDPGPMDHRGWGTKMMLDLTKFRPGLMVFDIGHDST